MRQRVMIAIALACNPQVLIADEPTTALDVTIQAQILDLMLELKEKLGTAIILITHDLGVVAETCERVIVMYAGRMVEEATVDELFARPLHPYTRGLLRALPGRRRCRASSLRLAEIPGIVPALNRPITGCAFAPRCELATERCRATRAGAARRSAPGTGSPAGKRAASEPPHERAASAWRCRDLVKHFPVHGGLLLRRRGTVKAVDGVSFAIRRAETLGLVGESGCGKTTVSRMVLKLLEPTSGRILLNGVDVTTLSPAAMWQHRRHVQIVFQDPVFVAQPAPFRRHHRRRAAVEFRHRVGTREGAAGRRAVRPCRAAAGER